MSDIRGALANITRHLTKTSGDLLKTTKLSVSLAGEQESLKNLYIAIGKQVHEIYRYGGTLGKFFDEKYREIEDCEQKINELKEKINLVKGTRECVKCGKIVEKTAEFCPKCGLRMDGANPAAAPSGSGDICGDPTETPPVPPVPVAPPIPAVPPIPSVVPEAPARVKCGACGAENEPDSKFCLTCGRIL